LKLQFLDNVVAEVEDPPSEGEGDVFIEEEVFSIICLLGVMEGDEVLA
jgi:hypothetical protein